MGPQLQYLETVLTCRGNYYAPDLHNHVDDLKRKLQQLIADDTNNLVLKKVEPWNSVRVTFNMPVEAARRLKELAERRDSILRELGILAVQIEGDRVISLTLESKSNDPTSSEVVVSFPTPPAPESTRLEPVKNSHQNLDMHTVLEKEELIGATLASGTSDGALIGSAAANPIVSLYKENAEKWPAIMDNIHVPVSSNAKYASASTAAFICNSPDVNNLRHAQFVAYELQPLQQPFEQPSNFINDISAQTSNGLARPMCAQTRLNLDEGRTTIPISLSILHAAQSSLNRVWSRIEDRLPINNNIASSSPLLVNLLKSPGGRHPQPNLVPRLQNPDMFYPGVMLPQKRRRSQQRAPKRAKIDLDGKKQSELANMSVLLDAVGSSSVSQGGTFYQLNDGQSASGVIASSCVPGLAINDSLLTSTAVACPDAQNKQRFMINPYTGDLEEVGEVDDLDGNHELDFSKVLKETSCWTDGLGFSGIHLLPSGLLKDGVCQTASVANHSPLKITSEHSGNSSATATNVPRLSNISAGLEVKDVVTSIRESSKTDNSENSLATSIVLNTLGSVSSLNAFPMPNIASSIAGSSHFPLLSSSQVSLLASTSFHAKSSIFQHVSLSHSDHQGSMALVQSKPVTSSLFTAICTNQATADTVPVPVEPASLEQLNNLAITSSFHQFCSMTMQRNAGSIVHPSSLPLRVLPSTVCPSILPPAALNESSKESASDAVALPRTFAIAETAGNSLPGYCAAAAVDSSATSVLGQVRPVSCFAGLTKLPVGNQGCLLQPDKTGEAPVVEVKSTVTETSTDGIVCASAGNISSAFETAAAYPAACSADVANVKIMTSTHGELPLNSVAAECSLKPEANYGATPQLPVESNCPNDLEIPLTFSFASLPQDFISVAFGQNGRIPVISCPAPNPPGKSTNYSSVVGDGKDLGSISSANCQAYAGTDAAATRLVNHLVLQKDSMEDGNADDGKPQLHAFDKDLILPPEKVVSASLLPSVSGNQTVVGDLKTIASSALSVEQTADVFQVPSQVLPEICGPGVLAKVTAALDVHLPSVSSCDGEPFAAKLASDTDFCNAIDKGIEPVFARASSSSSSGDSANSSQQLSDASQGFSTDVLKLGTKLTAASPLQSFLQLPVSGSAPLTWDTKLMLPLSGLKAMSIAVMANADSLQSSVSHTTEPSLTAFEKFGFLSSMKPVMTIGPLTMNSLCQKENPGELSVDSVKIKQDGLLERAEDLNACMDLGTKTSEGANSSIAMPIDLQDLIVMQVSSSELQTSGSTNHPIQLTNPESNTPEVCDDSLGVEPTKLSQPVSLPTFAGPPMRFALYPEAKMFASREPSHRKSGRSADDSLPRSKATLTVAKLLEKAESAKLNQQPPGRLTDASFSMETSQRQLSMVSQLPFLESVCGTVPLLPEMPAKTATVSSAVTRTNLGGISANCLPSKMSMNVSASLTRSFSLMDSNPLSITAPSYPLNLTESVQKVMKGVGLDTSPPPSPKPSTSNRLSPAKFGGVLASTMQSRCLASYGGILSGGAFSETKFRDLAPSSQASTGSFVVSQTISNPDSLQTSAVSLSTNGDLAQQKVDSSDSQTNSDEGVSLSSVFGQSETADFHAAIAPVLAEKQSLIPGCTAKTSGTCLDQPTNVPVFCPVDHSYSALPNPSAKKLFTEQSKDNFCDSIEDLPEHLNSVEDCHDTEEQFYEIMETQVNHFEDSDLFIDDLTSLEGITAIGHLNEVDSGNSNDCLEEEVEECVVDPQQEMMSSELVGTVCSEEVRAPDSSLDREDRLEHLIVKTLNESDDRRPDESLFNNTEGCETVAAAHDAEKTDAVSLPKTQEDRNSSTGGKMEELSAFETTESPTPCVQPVSESSTDNGEGNFVHRDKTKDNDHSQTTGDCLAIPASICDDFKSPMSSKLPPQRAKNRKGLGNRVRRGGRFARIGSSDGKLEPSDESERSTVVENSFECISEVDAVTDESLDSVNSKTSFLVQLPSSGCMTTRSRGRKTPWTVENADLSPHDPSVTAGWTSVASQHDMSSVASKLNDNSQHLENPIFLRRSTRTLRKGESISSSEPNNCELDVKFVATRSRKRLPKDVRSSSGSRSVRNSERNATAPITEEFPEAVDSSRISCLVESGKGGMHDHEEVAAPKDGKELPTRKSKT